MKIEYKRKLLMITILIWMITIFLFSGQPSNKSTATSNVVINAIVNTLPSTKHESKQAKEDLVKNMKTPIRKLAHFSVYAIGGVLLINLLNTYNINLKIKIFFSFIIGVIYASTDEFHQFFVQGRSCEFRDIVIDSLGILLGIGIFICLLYIYDKKSSKKAKEKVL